jgi:hypothetical protein
MNSPISKRHASLVNFEQYVIVMHTASFSMNFQLQAAAKHSHNSYLQASAFKTSLLARKLHVKFFLYAKKRDCEILVSYPYEFSLLSLACLSSTLPQADCTQPPCSQ